MVKINFINARRKRRKKVLKLAKGYFGSKSKLYKTAHEQVMRSLQYAYRDRRQKKRDFRKLWITRINAGCNNFDISYSFFIHGLSLAKVEINRKMLSDMVYHSPEIFQKYVNIAKTNLEEEKKQAKVVTTINNPIPAIKQTVINSKNIIDAKVKEVADDSEVSTDNFVVSTQKLETTQNKSTKTFVQKLLKNNEKAKVNIETNQNIEKVQIIDSSSTNVILDLEQMSLSDLKQVAKEKKIKNISKFKKKELIDYLIKIM